MKRFSILFALLLLSLGCGKGEQKQASTPPPPPPEEVVKKPADQQSVEQPQPRSFDQRNTNYRQARSQLGGARNAARNLNFKNDFDQLGKFIEMAYTDNNARMPTAEQIKADLKKSAPNLYAFIEEGQIILTGNTDHAGLWAYEVDGDSLGGFFLLGGTAQRDDARVIADHLKNVKK